MATPKYNTVGDMVDSGNTRFTDTTPSAKEALDLYIASERLGSIQDDDTLIALLLKAGVAPVVAKGTNSRSPTSIAALQNQAIQVLGFNDPSIRQQLLDTKMKTFIPGSQGGSREGFVETPSQEGGSQSPSGRYNPDDLKNSAEFKKLSEDDQEAVLAVFEAIATNDSKKAAQLIKNFETAAKINEPFYAQKFKIAADTLKRGFVSIDKDLEYNEELQTNRLNDLRQDIESRKEFLTLEEQAALRGIEREYSVQLEDTRQNLAATGKTFSTVRQEREQLLEETTGDLRESTERRFGMQQIEADRTLGRGERNSELELERLRQLAGDKKLDLFREGEQLLGSDNLPELPGFEGQPLGDIYGQLPQDKLQNTLNSATSFTF